MSPYEEKRLSNIRKGLHRGDVSEIARLAGVHRVWVSRVLNGHEQSERIVRVAENYLTQAAKERGRKKRQKPANTGL